MIEIELYKKGFSIPQISEKINKSKSTIRRILKKENILRSRTDGIRLRLSDKNYTHPRTGVSHTVSKSARAKIAKSKIGKGKGYSLKPNGYYEVTTGENKGRMLHVVLMEKHIGRKMLKNEVVHHIDENKTNNDLSNLEVMTRSEHSRLHAIKNYSKKNINKKGQFKKK